MTSRDRDGMEIGYINTSSLALPSSFHTTPYHCLLKRVQKVTCLCGGVSLQNPPIFLACGDGAFPCFQRRKMLSAKNT
jgi:hypothetical protein